MEIEKITPLLLAGAALTILTHFIAKPFMLGGLLEVTALNVLIGAIGGIITSAVAVCVPLLD